ncbi:DNA-binding protein WhiA [Acholeplasma equirhinis]|uniref:DNA-binding protein WhiA n=1 Tax=Acholeplasma equirhinis TaxID=555393 RepID=UPI00197A8B9D|nr:DNA-binding protein WhiA [Acholeplasma equirhinis]MBN3490973.1 DNA-binding protein WhiA [Acholeplasma equirhinis]
MSFAKIVKEELIQLHLTKEEELAELAAMIELATEFTIAGGEPMLWFKSNNPTVARRFLTLLKKLYNVGTTLLTKKQGNFKKGYQIQLGIKDAIEEIRQEHGIFTDNEEVDLLIQTRETKEAYLRGAFLAAGSVNDPKTAEYHLEIYAESKETILRIQQTMNYFDLNAKITHRRNGLICYLKDVNSIEDFLRIIGASDTVFSFEDIRIKRDFNNSINRILNCEIANEKKTIVAANQQLQDIKLIEKFKVEIGPKLKQAVRLRKQYPDVSLNELVDIFEKEYKEKITKSGLNHRYTKLKELADDIRRSKA